MVFLRLLKTPPLRKGLSSHLLRTAPNLFDCPTPPSRGMITTAREQGGETCRKVADGNSHAQNKHCICVNIVNFRALPPGPAPHRISDCALDALSSGSLIRAS